LSDANCYELLGVSCRADIAEVKSAYRSLSKLHHPDVGGDASRQAALNLAKELLCDPVLRDAHDRRLRRIDPAFFREDEEGPQSVRPAPARRREAAAPNGPAAPSGKGPAPTPRKNRDGLRENVLRSAESLRERLRSEEAAKKAETAARFLKKRKDHMRLRSGAIAGCLVSLGACLIFKNPLPLLAAAACAYPLLVSLRLSLDGFEFSPDDLSENNIASVLGRYAEFRVNGAVNEKLAVWEKSKKHFEPGEFSFSAALPEKEMAVRLLLGFFGIGYVPRAFDPSARTLSFDDEDGLTLVRYRHRTGRPADIRFVRDLIAAAEREAASSGRAVAKLFLFSTAGFSENAKAECRSRGIAFYDAADFKEWLDGLRRRGFTGPRGDVFDALAKFDQVMGELRA